LREERNRRGVPECDGGGRDGGRVEERSGESSDGRGGVASEGAGAMAMKEKRTGTRSERKGREVKGLKERRRGITGHQ
jgi:hypothetical protein